MAKPVSRKRIEENIFRMEWESGRVSYQVQIKDRRGRWFPRRSFQIKAEAKAYKRACLSKEHVERAPTIGLVLFETFWDEWMTECRHGVTDGWKKDLRRYGKEFFLPVLSGLKMAEIRPRDIGEIIQMAWNRGYKPQTVRHVYNAIHKAFQDALEHFEYVEVNPVLKRYCPKVHKIQRSSLNPQEVAKLLHTIRGHYLAPAIYLGLLTGMRPCEIQALRWPNVDLARRRILIREIFRRKEMRLVSGTKQGDDGIAYLPEPLVEYLHTIPRHSEFVAPGRQGEMLPYETLARGLPALCEKAGVQRITPHEMRHSATELWVLNGATREDCARQLNHASTATTATYMHRTEDRQARIAAGFQLPEIGRSPTLATRAGDDGALVAGDDGAREVGQSVDTLRRSPTLASRAGDDGGTAWGDRGAPSAR